MEIPAAVVWDADAGTCCHGPAVLSFFNEESPVKQYNKYIHQQ